MTLHMLVQIPLLVGIGMWLARAVSARWKHTIASWDYNGISGLLLASLAGLIWMLPLALDAAIDVPAVTLAKFITIPLLIGMPVALSWARAGFVVRGVFMLELVATAYRLGWLYLISPERLCSNYLLSDQLQLGRLLIAIGLALTLVLGWKLLGGHIHVSETEPSQAPADHSA